MSVVAPVLAVLSVVAVAGSLLLLVAVGAPGAVGLRNLVLQRGHWLAFAVAATAMLGSLYFSEVAGLPPCEMCWFQRICMYPLVAILLVGALRRDRKVWMYASIPVLASIVIAAYHTQLQADRKSTRLNSSHVSESRMPSSA